MSATGTTLATALTSPNSKMVTLASATGAAKTMLMTIDDEWRLITDVSLSPTLETVPGYAGTVAGVHGVGATIAYGYPKDMGTVAGGPPSISYGASGAIAVPLIDQIIYLTKAGGAAAMTIADPAPFQTNTLKIISTTAQAHTLTPTTPFYNNTTSSDVATWPATVNAVLTLRANNGVWAPVATADDGVTIG